MKNIFILAILGLVGVAIVFPVISLHTLPFTDLPNHLAEATILKYSANPRSPLAQFYSASRLSLIQPSIGHAVFCSWFPSVEIGNRVLYVAYCIAIPIIMLTIARQCEGNRILAFLSVLMIWNFSALWGFSGFTIGIPLVLLSLTLHVRCIIN